jgi:hypothetical protein
LKLTCYTPFQDIRRRSCSHVWYAYGSFNSDYLFVFLCNDHICNRLLQKLQSANRIRSGESKKNLASLTPSIFHWSFRWIN